PPCARKTRRGSESKAWPRALRPRRRPDPTRDQKERGAVQQSAGPAVETRSRSLSWSVESNLGLCCAVERGSEGRQCVGQRWVFGEVMHLETVVEVVELLHSITVSDQAISAQLPRLHGPPTHRCAPRQARGVAHFHEQSISPGDRRPFLVPESPQRPAGERLGRLRGPQGPQRGPAVT